MKTFDNQWEIVHSTREWGRYPSEEVVRFVARNYFKRERENTKILDLGCGTGANAWFMAREGFNVTAVDGSLNAINKAKIMTNEESLTIDFFQADLGLLPFEDNVFDSIIDSAAISANTVEGIKLILKECFRTLKPSGLLFSTGLFKHTMTGFGKGEKIDNYTFRNITDGPLANIGNIHFFTEKEILSLFLNAGFGDIVIDSLERSDNGSKDFIKYYIVQAKKQKKEN